MKKIFLDANVLIDILADKPRTSSKEYTTPRKSNNKILRVYLSIDEIKKHLDSKFQEK